MNDCKDVSTVINRVMIDLYGKQTKDNKVCFILALYMNLSEEQQDAFLRIAKDTAKAKDKYYL